MVHPEIHEGSIRTLTVKSKITNGQDGQLRSKFQKQIYQNEDGKIAQDVISL